MNHAGPFCLHCHAPIPSGAYCDNACAMRGRRAWTQAETNAKAREAQSGAARAAGLPADTPTEEFINSTLETVTRVGKGLFSFLMAPSTEAFARDVDAANGTNLADQIRHVGGAFDPQGVHVERATAVPPRTMPIPPPPPDAEEEDVVVIIDAAPPRCSFCAGKTVVAINSETGAKVAVACPTCKAPPRDLKLLRAVGG